jgi:hypothetical protein
MTDSEMNNEFKIAYDHIEFFFSKDDLKSMMTIKPFSYESWLDSIYEYYLKEPEDGKTFHYNIMHTKEFKDINKLVKEIKELENDLIANKDKINSLFVQIQRECNSPNLYYYEETYMYAHYVFNNIRRNIIEKPELFKQVGGGHITLEEFKQKIRDKIKDMTM